MPVRRCRSTAACALVLLLAACAEREPAPAAADSPQFGGTVVIANNSDLEYLNSLVATDKYTQEFNRFALFLPLVRYDAELGFLPALAERWELTGDTGVIFHLRRDVRWHDGRPTQAGDVVFTFDRARDPETGFPNGEYFALWSAAIAVDSFTVRFSFQPHVEPLAGLPFLPIMPVHHLDSIPAARMRQAAFNRRPIGNGPFRFLEHRANERWIFEANPDFPQGLGGRPYLDRVVWRSIPDATAQITELTTGSADVVLTPASEQFDQLSARPGMRGIIRPTRQYASVMWNGRVAPLGQAAVRRALTMAINRQQIIETLRAGHGDVAVGPIGPFHWAFDNALPPLPFNADSARALLDAAGLIDSNSDGVREIAGGKPFEIALSYPANSPINRDITEMIRNDLAAVGVRITPRPLDYATLIQDLISPRRAFQSAVMAWESDFRINLRDIFHTAALDGPYQVASYSNPRVDTLLDRAAVTHDRDQARSIYGEVQRILRDEQPWSFLFNYPDLVLVRDRVNGVEMDIRGALLTIQQWWVADARTAGPAGNDSAARSRVQDPARSQ